MKERISADCRAIALLESHYNLMMLDTGTGVLQSPTRGSLQLINQIAVVMTARHLVNRLLLSRYSASSTAGTGCRRTSIPT